MRRGEVVAYCPDASDIVWPTVQQIVAPGATGDENGHVIVISIDVR
jgi:hypothetical protein